VDGGSGSEFGGGLLGRGQMLGNGGSVVVERGMTGSSSNVCDGYFGASEKSEGLTTHATGSGGSDHVDSRKEKASFRDVNVPPLSPGVCLDGDGGSGQSSLPACSSSARSNGPSEQFDEFKSNGRHLHSSQGCSNDSERSRGPCSTREVEKDQKCAADSNASGELKTAGSADDVRALLAQLQGAAGPQSPVFGANRTASLVSIPETQPVPEADSQVQTDQLHDDTFEPGYIQEVQMREAMRNLISQKSGCENDL
jgi:hypothetical protein